MRGSWAVSYTHLVGELVPKRIALADAEGMAKRVAKPLTVFQKIARPLVWLTQASADGLARILRIKNADDRQNVSEEEIRYMINEQDTLLDEEKRIIHEAVSYTHLDVYKRQLLSCGMPGRARTPRGRVPLANPSFQ